METLQLQDVTIKKVLWHVMPLCMVCGFIAFLDRVNVGYAALTMNADIGISAAAYGFGAGLFFVGYFFFEVPSNMILQKVGPRYWIARIMITWGIVAVGFGFIQGVTGFYVLRILLGVAEAGFFPGIILLLTYWFPRKSRALANSLLLCSMYFGGVVGAPMSGFIMTRMDQLMGVAGWRWLFIIEGIPAIIVAFIVLRHMHHKPEQVKWLEQDEKAALSAVLEKEAAESPMKHGGFFRTISNPFTLVASVSYFLAMIDQYGMMLWAPQFIKNMGEGLGTMAITTLAMVPNLSIIIAMLIVSVHSDKTGERFWHFSIPMFVGAVGFFIAGQEINLFWCMVGIAMAGFSVGGFIAVFWGYIGEKLGPLQAAVGIAVINSIGNLGGFVGPSVVGLFKSITGSFSGGVYTIGVGCIVLVILMFINDRVIIKKVKEKEARAKA